MLVPFSGHGAFAGAFSSTPVRMTIGLVGWVLMLSACAVVIVHPHPNETFLGKFAFRTEPLLRGETVDTKRKLLTLSVVGLAIFSVVVSVLFFSGAIYALYEKYVFGN